MKSTRQVFEELLRVLDRVVGRLGAMHQAPREYGTGVPLYGSEIHTIQAIGESAGITVTRLAEKRGVTKGAVSQTLSKLVEKGMVRKTRAHDNAKEVVLELTERGWTGFRNHGTFDMKVLDSVREYCGSELETKLDTFLSVMTDFEAILTMHEQRHQSAGRTKENG
jgi:DNA-binding MarR family transcriptional regulator